MRVLYHHKKYIRYRWSKPSERKPTPSLFLGCSLLERAPGQRDSTDMMKLSKATVAHVQTEALNQASCPWATLCGPHIVCEPVGTVNVFSLTSVGGFQLRTPEVAVIQLRIWALTEPVPKGWPLVREEWTWHQKGEVAEGGWCTAVSALGPKSRIWELHGSREADANAPAQHF